MTAAHEVNTKRENQSASLKSDSIEFRYLLENGFTK